VVTGMWREVTTSTFLEGAQEHRDGLAGYVRDFLKKYEGKPNEFGRAWSPETCADALKISSGTLGRWLSDVGYEPRDQQESAPYTPEQKRESERGRVRESTARSVLIEPEERRPLLAALPSDVRDEIRAELIDLDVPSEATRCRHCPTHCPEGGSR